MRVQCSAGLLKSVLTLFLLVFHWKLVILVGGLSIMTGFCPMCCCYHKLWQCVKYVIASLCVCVCILMYVRMFITEKERM